MSNELQKLILKYPDKSWNWEDLGKNPNVTIEFFEKYLEGFFGEFFHRFYWYDLSFNPSITLEIIERYLPEDLYPAPHRWYWGRLSKNPNITIEFIEKYINKGWCTKYLSENPAINIEFVKKYINKKSNWWNNDWDWLELSRNKSITVEDINKNPHLPWDYDGISANPNITLEHVNENIFPFTKKGLSRNPNITIEFVKEYLDLPLPNRESISDDYDWFELSKNSNIIFEDVIKNPDLPWNWYSLSLNPNVTFNIVEKYPNNEWQWLGLSQNPNITFNIVEKYMNIESNPLWFPYTDKTWNFSYGLTRNKLKYDEGLERVHFNKLKKIRKRIKSFKIKKWYKLYLLTKEQKFWKWYCAPGNVGNKVDKKRIMDHFADKK